MIFLKDFFYGQNLISFFVLTEFRNVELSLDVSLKRFSTGGL